MYKCLECGHIFEQGEEAKWTETHGFTGGICKECLIGKITVDATKAYVLWANLEKEFYFKIFMNSQVRRYSPRLLQTVKDAFDEYAKSHPIEALTICKPYIAFADEGLTDFAEFLEQKQ